MTGRWNASRAGGLGVLALASTMASAMGCESQVDDEYTGESLLSLQGNVLLTEDQTDDDLVPQLAFFGQQEGGSYVVLVDGELTGEFPAKFRFDVTQPPPEATLQQFPAEWGFNGKGTWGVMVMLPPNRGDQLPYIAEYTFDEYCNDDGTQCTRKENGCVDDDGPCRQRELECTRTPCELVEQLGDPELGLTTTGQTTYSCDATSCYSIYSACDDEEGHCRTDVYRCDVPESDAVEDAFDGMITTCRVQSEIGDTSLMRFEDLNTVAANYFVVYATEDSPDSLFGSLERGYNLVQMTTSLEAWLASEKCQIAAMETAVDEYNLEHGTDYRQFNLDVELAHLQVAAFKQCSPLRVIPNPLGETLSIELGSGLPQPFGG